MEVPSTVLVHNELLGLKGTGAELIRISDDGYYELNMGFGSNVHRVLMPIATTVVIAREPEIAISTDDEIER